MTLEQFEVLIEKNPRIKKDDSSVLAKRLGESEETIKEFRKRIKEKKKQLDLEVLNTPSLEQLEAVNFRVETSDPRIPVSLKGFEVSSFKLNKDGLPAETWFKKQELKDMQISVEEIDWLKIKPKAFLPSKNKHTSNKCMQIIFPTDAHISRMELNGRTLQEKCQQVLDKITEAVELAQKLYSIDTIVFITGSDMLNSTGKTSHTVRGTLQEDNTSYDKAFDAAVNLNVSIIDYLYNNCNELNVISVLGNHDEIECYMLGKYLQAYYRNLPIKFDIDKKYRKYFSFGNTGIQIHHGNVPKFEYLVSSFASESPETFCKKFSECIVGDKHHQKVTQVGKTIIRQFPSLAENDTWSEEMGFVKTQGLVSEVYEFEKGHVLSIDLKS